MTKSCETCLGCGKTGWAPTGPYHHSLGLHEINEVAITTLMKHYPDDGSREELWDVAGPCTSCNGSGVEPIGDES